MPQRDTTRLQRYAAQPQNKQNSFKETQQWPQITLNVCKYTERDKHRGVCGRGESPLTPYPSVTIGSRSNGDYWDRACVSACVRSLRSRRAAAGVQPTRLGRHGEQLSRSARKPEWAVGRARRRTEQRRSATVHTHGAEPWRKDHRGGAGHLTEKDCDF